MNCVAAEMQVPTIGKVSGIAFVHGEIGRTSLGINIIIIMLLIISPDMRFPTLWFVRPAKPQISLRLRAV